MRGLKSYRHTADEILRVSHSTRVRGLKYVIRFRRVLVAKVALYTSAWIEIHGLSDGLSTCQVALYTSAWIEISKGSEEIGLQNVALYTSAWIEMFDDGAFQDKDARRTLHECVD